MTTEILKYGLREARVYASFASVTTIVFIFLKITFSIFTENETNAHPSKEFGKDLTPIQEKYVPQQELKTQIIDENALEPLVSDMSGQKTKETDGELSQIASLHGQTTLDANTEKLKSEDLAFAKEIDIKVSSIDAFRWPVRGKIIAEFGQKVNGQPNEGINLAVPEGTSVKASGDGEVIYSGDELKGYGKLVLVRHRNGFITAYAHASELLVNRGDKVSRGQIIARTGATGAVNQPQLHFELRQGQKPIDPKPYLSSN